CLVQPRVTRRRLAGPPTKEAPPHEVEEIYRCARARRARRPRHPRAPPRALVALVAAVTTATSVARSTSSNRLAGLPNTCHTFGKGKYVIASDLPLQGSL